MRAPGHYVCHHCKSPNVLFDAWAEWDYESQSYKLHSEFDNAHCQDCEGETHAQWVAGPPPKEEE